MGSRLLVAVVAGVVGLALGAGIGVASARTGVESPRAPVSDAVVEDSAPPFSMDDMHNEMHDEMPQGFRAVCDEMHADMADHGGPSDSAGMGSMMGAGTVDRAEHHG